MRCLFNDRPPAGTGRIYLPLPAAFRRFVLPLFFLLLAAVPAAGDDGETLPRSAAPPGGSLVIARVGRENITRGDLVGLLDEYEGRGREEVLSEVIERRLLFQHARYAGLEIDEREVDQRLDAIIRNFPSLVSFYRHLEERGLSVRQLRRRISEQLLGSRLVAREVVARVWVDPRELREFMETNRREIIALGTRVHLEMAGFPAGTAVPEESREIEPLLEEHVLPVAELPPLLRLPALQLEPGRLSEPVDLGREKVVLRVRERFGGESLDEPSLMLEARRLLFAQKRQEHYNRFIRELRARTTIEYYDF